MSSIRFFSVQHVDSLPSYMHIVRKLWEIRFCFMQDISTMHFLQIG